MFTIVARNSRKAISAVAAVAIVSASGLVLDQAHLAAAPQGSVEVGELAPVDALQIAALPEVVVRAPRERATRLAATTELPEVVVVARRIASFAAAKEGERLHAPAVNAGY